MQKSFETQLVIIVGFNVSNEVYVNTDSSLFPLDINETHILCLHFHIMSEIKYNFYPFLLPSVKTEIKFSYSHDQ